MQTDPAKLFIEAWRLMTGRLPSPVFEEADRLTCCFCDAPNMFFNLWIQNRPAGTLEEMRELLGEGQVRAERHHQPVGGIVRQDWLPEGWESVPEEVGLAPLMPLISMEAEELLAPRRPAADLEIRRVEDDAGARDVAYLNAHAYEMPVETFERLATIGFWAEDWHGFVAYVDGEPMSCAATMPAMGTVYVALVATSEAARGKGYAETVMRHAVAAGQKAMGIERTTLHASLMGHPLYRAMGYSSDATLWLVGPPLEEEAASSE